MDHRDDNSWSSCHHSHSDNCHFSRKYFPPLWFSVLYSYAVFYEVAILWSRKSGVEYKTDVRLLRKVSAAYTPSDWDLRPWAEQLVYWMHDYRAPLPRVHFKGRADQVVWARSRPTSGRAS